jgi:hypothetical protein
MSNCSNCGSRPYLCQRCRLEDLEDRIGTPTDHNIDRWVLENDRWHASTEFDGQTHECACGTEIETPLKRSAEDFRYVPEKYDAPVCEGCVTELEEPRRETVPADATFERASKLMTDGGTDRSYLPRYFARLIQNKIYAPSRSAITNAASSIWVITHSKERVRNASIGVSWLSTSKRISVPTDTDRADNLVTDGGYHIDVDAIREAVPFWIQFQGRRASAIHIPAENCTRDDPDSACQYERSATPWTFDPDNIPDTELHSRLCKACVKRVLGIEEDNSKYGRTPADVLAENGFDQDDEDDETSVPVTDGGRAQFSAVSFRRRTRHLLTPRLLRRQHLARDRPLALRQSLLRLHLCHRSSTNWCCLPYYVVGALGDITSLPIGFGSTCPVILQRETTSQRPSEGRELRTDGGNLEEVYRRETIIEGPDGKLQIGDRDTVEEIGDVCSTLEALQKEVENPEVDAALQSAVSHIWRASILQRVDENTDVRMNMSSGSSGVVVYGSDPAEFKRDGGDSQ